MMCVTILRDCTISVRTAIFAKREPEFPEASHVPEHHLHTFAEPPESHPPRQSPYRPRYAPVEGDEQDPRDYRDEKGGVNGVVPHAPSGKEGERSRGRDEAEAGDPEHPVEQGYRENLVGIVPSPHDVEYFVRIAADVGRQEVVEEKPHEIELVGPHEGKVDPARPQEHVPLQGPEEGTDEKDQDRRRHQRGVHAPKMGGQPFRRYPVQQKGDQAEAYRRLQRPQ